MIKWNIFFTIFFRYSLNNNIINSWSQVQAIVEEAISVMQWMNYPKCLLMLNSFLIIGLSSFTSMTSNKFISLYIVTQIFFYLNPRITTIKIKLWHTTHNICIWKNILTFKRCLYVYGWSWYKFEANLSRDGMIFHKTTEFFSFIKIICYNISPGFNLNSTHLLP